MINKVLLVDDDRAVREALGQSLELADLRPVLAGSYIEAKDHLSRDFAGVVVTDLRMPGKDGFAVLECAQERDGELPVIVLTGEGNVPSAVRGIAEGAFDFLEKPCAPEDLLAVIRKALEKRAGVLQSRALKLQTESGDAAARLLFGASGLAEELRERVRAVAATPAEVLITGPPGSGIAKVAEVIHLLSGLAGKSFSKLGAAGVEPEALREFWAAADGGTVFIDAIGQLPAGSQFTLLDLLEQGGGPRLVAGTYQDLGALAGRGDFNAELFYKLDVMRVRIPSLAERKEDIPVLFRHYVAIACEQADLPVPDITPDVVSGLLARDWPGNARALMNAAMRFALGQPDAGEYPAGLGLTEQMAQVERSLLAAALERHAGNATKTARALKLPRKTFYDKLARHGLRPENYRTPG